ALDDLGSGKGDRPARERQCQTIRHCRIGRSTIEKPERPEIEVRLSHGRALAQARRPQRSFSSRLAIQRRTSARFSLNARFSVRRGASQSLALESCLSMANPPGKCIFCGGGGLSKEHVWSEWTHTYIGPDKRDHFRASLETSRRGPKKRNYKSNKNY